MKFNALLAATSIAALCAGAAPASAQSKTSVGSSVGDILAACPPGIVYCIHPAAVANLLQTVVAASCFTDSPTDCPLANATVTGAMMAPNASAANLNLGAGWAATLQISLAPTIQSAISSAENGAGPLTGSSGIPALTSGYTGYFAADSVQTQMYGWGATAGGISMQSQFWAGWGVTENTIPDGETEGQYYTHFRNGIATSVLGTNHINFSSGTAWSSDMAQSGLQMFWFNQVPYIVTAASPSQVTVTTVSGGAVSFGANTTAPFYYGGVKATNTCQVTNTGSSSATVTTSPGAGQPFFGLGTIALFINGVNYSSSASYVSNAQMNLSVGAATAANATCVEYGILGSPYTPISPTAVGGQFGKVSIQGLNGNNEEVFGLFAQPWTYDIASEYAGLGQYKRIRIRTGEYPLGTPQVMLDAFPSPTVGSTGTLALGGRYGGNETLDIFPKSASGVIKWVMQNNNSGGPALMACRSNGTDTDVGCQFDALGAGIFNFTSHAYGKSEFQIWGTGGNDYPVVTSGNGTVLITAGGADGNININLAPPGSGTLQVGGVAGVSCSGVPTSSAVWTKGIRTTC